MHRMGCLLLLLALPASASPTFRLNPAGVALPLEVNGANTCVIHPAALREAAACKGVDVAALAAQLPGPDVVPGTFVLLFDRFGALLTVVRTHAPTGQAPGTEPTQLVEGARRALRQKYGPDPWRVRGLAPGAEYDTLTLGGYPAYRILHELPSGANDGMDRMLVYAFQSGDSLVFVTWSTAAEHLGTMIPAADAAMARLQRAAPKEQSSTAFEVGEVVRQLSALLGACFLSTLFLRRRRKPQEKQAPPTAP